MERIISTSKIQQEFLFQRKLSAVVFLRRCDFGVLKLGDEEVEFWWLRRGFLYSYWDRPKRGATVLFSLYILKCMKLTWSEFCIYTYLSLLLFPSTIYCNILKTIWYCIRKKYENKMSVK